MDWARSEPERSEGELSEAEDRSPPSFKASMCHYIAIINNSQNSENERDYVKQVMTIPIAFVGAVPHTSNTHLCFHELGRIRKENIKQEKCEEERGPRRLCLTSGLFQQIQSELLVPLLCFMSYLD